MGNLIAVTPIERGVLSKAERLCCDTTYQDDENVNRALASVGRIWTGGNIIAHRDSVELSGCES